MARREAVVDVAVDWSRVDTVLLDMDGTLLDLGFDNWFWRELVPRHYGAANDMSASDAWEVIQPRFAAVHGTMQWYCIEHWTREFGLDIAHIKRTAQERIRYLPGAEEFLVKLTRSGKRRVLVTNAHPLTLAVKDMKTGLSAHFDACHSTHEFGVPKEHRDLWPQLEAVVGFDPERTLFVDDSVPVLDAARAFGIRWIRAIRYPDSGLGPQATGEHIAIDRIADLL